MKPFEKYVRSELGSGMLQKCTKMSKERRIFKECFFFNEKLKTVTPRKVESFVKHTPSSS